MWFTPGWFRANWWAAVDGTDCTAEEMSKALEHSLGGLGNSVNDNNQSRIIVSDKVATTISCICLLCIKSFTECRTVCRRFKCHKCLRNCED